MKLDGLISLLLKRFKNKNIHISILFLLCLISRDYLSEYCFQIEYFYCEGMCDPITVGPRVFTTSAAFVLYVSYESLLLMPLLCTVMCTVICTVMCTV